jgi:hypothetical protein
VVNNVEVLQLVPWCASPSRVRIYYFVIGLHYSSLSPVGLHMRALRRPCHKYTVLCIHFLIIYTHRGARLASPKHSVMGFFRGGGHAFVHMACSASELIQCYGQATCSVQLICGSHKLHRNPWQQEAEQLGLWHLENYSSEVAVPRDSCSLAAWVTV